MKKRSNPVAKALKGIRSNTIRMKTLYTRKGRNKKEY